ncbi:hypothetical protein [Persephonella sp.]
MINSKFFKLGLIIATILTIILFFILPKKYAYSLLIIYSSILIFSVLVWINDKFYNEQINVRTFSISDKNFIKDVVTRQMNMHGVTKIVDNGNEITFYKGKEKTGSVKFKTDEQGNLLKIDGKYIIEIEAPEYILHNIDHETWSIIGKK